MKIAAFTNTRSEYDLLSYLFQALHADDEVDFRLIVSGAHLSPTYGLSVRQIESDGLPILDRIETHLDSDTDLGRIKSASILLQTALHSVDRFRPDLLMYAGDREEVLIGAMIGGYLKVPTMHFFAGDHDCDGSIDNPVRHATSRMSAYCMVSMAEHRDRLVATGINPERVHVIGSCALDKFRREPLVDREGLLDDLGASPNFRGTPYALMIHHALMDREEDAFTEFTNILECLRERSTPTVVISPNIDPGSRQLMKMWEGYKSDPNFLFVNNLPRPVFLGLYRQAAFQIGNSSAGTCEAASIPLPVLNVGHRMVGRRAQSNVVFCDGSREAIRAGLDRVTSQDFFRDHVEGIENIYGDGNSCQRAYEIIKGLDLESFAEFRVEDPLNFATGR